MAAEQPAGTILGVPEVIAAFAAGMIVTTIDLERNPEDTAAATIDALGLGSYSPALIRAAAAEWVSRVPRDLDASKAAAPGAVARALAPTGSA